MLRTTHLLPVLGTAATVFTLVAGLTPPAAATVTHGPVRPAQVGHAKVGMSVNRAMQTGQFNRDVTYTVPGVCTRRIALETKGRWKNRYDVVVANGRIKEMGVFAARPRTANGSGVGTELRTLRSRYGARLTAPTEAGYGQWAVFVRPLETGADRRWLGFLLGRAYTYQRPARPGDTVTFMAVAKGKRPHMVRDGC
jgi:hypothetical protein